MQIKKGLFIVFEGVDGAGTTTQQHRLIQYIEELDKYQDVLRTHEPWRSNEIRRKLQQDPDAYSSGLEMARLYIDDRAEHTRRLIRPNLDAGVFVLSDRYSISTCTYQWVQGVDLEYLINWHKDRGIIVPDATFYIDVPREVAVRRLIERGAPAEKFEKDTGFMDRLVEAYRSIVHITKVKEGIFGKVIGIDGNRPIEIVTADVREKFKELYSAWNSEKEPYANTVVAH